jgi:hypothetical protein
VSQRIKTREEIVVMSAGTAVKNDGGRAGADPALEDADTTHIPATGISQLMLSGDRGAP